jgi:hypothetical protein
LIDGRFAVACGLKKLSGIIKNISQEFESSAKITAIFNTPSDLKGDVKKSGIISEDAVFERRVFQLYFKSARF